MKHREMEFVCICTYVGVSSFLFFSRQQPHERLLIKGASVGTICRRFALPHELFFFLSFCGLCGIIKLQVLHK